MVDGDLAVMDPSRFDTLVRRLSTESSRRRLLGVLSSLPLVRTALATSDDDATAAKSKGHHVCHGKRQNAERSPQYAGVEAQDCAKRCRKKSTKQARRRCRKRCTPPTPECTTSADCPAGELCESDVCIPISDQCANDTDCDDCERCADGVCIAQCAPDEVCRANQCETVQCTADRDCGDCSRCQDGRCRWRCTVTEVCLSGAGGRCCQPHGCPPGLDCGTVDDGCEGQARCGSCTSPETCGGGGTPNVCGCTPITACPAGLTCGTLPDGCGSQLTCGVCANPTPICTANVCSPCTTDAQCARGEICAEGQCVAGGGTCEAGANVCTAPGFTAPCNGIPDCFCIPNRADGTRCAQYYASGQGFLRPCTSDAQCADLGPSAFCPPQFNSCGGVCSLPCASRA